MSFRLAVVGHSSSVEEIMGIVAETFDNVETTGVELASDEMTDEAVERLRSLLPCLDGVLYTRSEPYKLIISRLDHAGVLARYVNVDASSFIQSLLIASLQYGADISRVSVDTLDYNTVMDAYGSLKFSAQQVHPAMVNIDTNASHFVDAAAQAHREIYHSGLCSACITNIRSVQDTLAGEGIPCVLMTPGPDIYINEIRRLILHWQTTEKTKGNTAIVRIRAELNNDYYLHQKTMVQNVLDLGKLTEAIVMFAQLVSGAFIHAGEQDFYIVCGYKELSDATSQFANLDLLAQVYAGTPYRLAVGIGTGISMQAAMTNAELGTQKAWVEGCNRAYVVHEKDHIIGPIQPNELLHMCQTQVNYQLTKVAQDCGMSVNTILRIDTFVRKKNSGSFITDELARELHVSFRTAARMVEKLEKNHYIVEIGRRAINGRGRPSRLFRLLW